MRVWFGAHLLHDYRAGATAALAKVTLPNGFKNRTADFAEADRLAGITKRPRGTTWHHHEDKQTMLLMNRDLHQAVGHWGGIRVTGIENQEGRK